MTPSRSLLLSGLCAALGATAQAQLAVRGKTVHTMATGAIQDGVVLIQGSRIERVGKAAELRIPAGYEVLEAKVVTPGLIDAHSVIGLSGYLNQKQDQDQLERSAPMQPELRAIDAYNPRERLVDWVRGLAVTTIHTGHGPGAVISGQTMVVKTTGNSVEEALLRPFAMLAATLGDGAKGKDGKSPGNRAKAVAMLRGLLVKAREYLTGRRNASPEKKPDRDLGLEALGEVLEKRVPLLVTVHRAHDILAALRVGSEFGIDLVLDGCAEAYLVKDRIAAAGVPILVHPPMMRTHGETENATMELAAICKKAGIPFAFQSGFESYVPKTRVVLWEAAIALANGSSFDDTLAAITIEAAKILGVDDRVGSLVPGKDADLALFDGDPFEYTSHCTGVVINGKPLGDGPR
ncbi:MAG: amidohydrolase family protein [Planctomycetota bacterium]